MAGIGSMNYIKFFSYNVIGAILWVLICTLAGYFFGNIEIVKKNFGLVVIAIIFISVLPMLIEIIKFKLENKREKA
jgi:membrane-associated protein